MLGLGSYQFNKDAEKLVLVPLERMIERVKIVSKRPMALISVEEIEKAGALNVVKKPAKNQAEKKK